MIRTRSSSNAMSSSKFMLELLRACEESNSAPMFGQCEDASISVKLPFPPSPADRDILAKDYNLKCFTGPRTTMCFLQEKDRGHAWPWPLAFKGVFIDD